MILPDILVDSTRDLERSYDTRDMQHTIYAMNASCMRVQTTRQDEKETCVATANEREPWRQKEMKPRQRFHPDNSSRYRANVLEACARTLNKDGVIAVTGFPCVEGATKERHRAMGKHTVQHCHIPGTLTKV